MSHIGLVLKLKYIGVGGCVLSFCRVLLSNHRKKLVVDGAASDWIPIVSGVPQGSVLGHLLLILHTSELFELMEDRLYYYIDASTLLAAIHKSVDRTAASLNRDLARIREWCSHWCMILNPNKTQALVVSRYWDSPSDLITPLSMVTWSCLGFPNALIRTSTSLVWSLAASSPSKTMCVVLFLMSLRELVFWGWWNIHLWTPLCYFVASLY